MFGNWIFILLLVSEVKSKIPAIIFSAAFMILGLAMISIYRRSTRSDFGKIYEDGALYNPDWVIFNLEI